jgi:hypothetical protein
VLIPVKQPCETLEYVLGRLNEIKRAVPGLISEILIESEGSLQDARVSLASRAQDDLILNLDADTLIPLKYLPRAIILFDRCVHIGALALDYYPEPQGHLAFGTSVMPRDLFLRSYDWKGALESKACECLYMWRKLTALGWILSTLPLAAEHKRRAGNF